MACCPTEEKYGYDDSRFEKEVDENFHCLICYNVLKEPRTCRNNEHLFCLACITRYLKLNSETCPECSEYLSVGTLRRPRVVCNYLSKQKINCDYASRGCSEFIFLEELDTHVKNCGYAPVLCSNAGCDMAINKQDKACHETEACEYARVKCHDCEQISEVVERLEGSLLTLHGKVEAARNINKEMKTELRKEIYEVVEAANGQTKKELVEVKKEVKEIKDNFSKVNKDVDEVKIMMNQMVEKLNKLELYFTEGILRPTKKDILIAGGYRSTIAGKSTEIYSWKKNGWFEVASMNEDHEGGSLFIYNNQLFVVGGTDTNTIESMDLTELLLKWTKYPEELPYVGDDHKTVVHTKRVIHVGGYNYDEEMWCKMISELQVPSSSSLDELCLMPEPRGCHGAVVFGDQVLILGGTNSDMTLDSVLKFDLKTNTCEEMPQLPFAMARMATARCRDEAVVLGGCNKDDQVLNDVFMYNCKTGVATALPPMLMKRRDCCAVVTDHTIVVMGGMNDKDEVLTSVECFTMGDSTWEYLPDMNKPRFRAVAEVLPGGRDYV